MTKRTTRRNYRRHRDRRIWVDSTLRPDLEPTQVAQIITKAALAQAHLEAQARAAHHAHTEVEAEVRRPGAATDEEASHA